MSKMVATLETTSTVIVDNTLTLFPTVSDPVPVNTSDRYLISPVQHLQFFEEDLEYNDFVTRHRQAIVMLPDDSIRTAPDCSMLS